MNKILSILPWVLTIIFGIVIVVSALIYFNTYTGVISEKNLFFGRYVSSLESDLKQSGVYEIFTSQSGVIKGEKYEIVSPFSENEKTIDLTWNYATASNLDEQSAMYETKLKEYCEALEPSMQNYSESVSDAVFTMGEESSRGDRKRKFFSCMLQDQSGLSFGGSIEEQVSLVDTRNTGFEILITSHLRK